MKIDYLKKVTFCMMIVMAMSLFSCSDSDNPDTTTPEAGHTVDLGLSVLWADCNVGAACAEDKGGLYGWGDADGIATTIYVWNESGDTWVSDLYGGPNPPADISGTELDIARVKWKGEWRMPTKEEMQELRDKCIWTWCERDGIAGMRVTGPSGESIFLPAAGLRAGDVYIPGASPIGNYWTSTLDDVYSNNAFCLGFNEQVIAEKTSPDWRYAGHSVRPVMSRNQ